MTLDFTGERVVPGRVDEFLWWEHLARYRFAARLVSGMCVLDLGCGAGYGSALLQAAGAQRVLGLDIAGEATQYAHENYASRRVSFLTGAAERIPLAAGSCSRVVSFELMEHVENYRAMLQEARRVLRPDGLLIVSTPNRVTYRDEGPAAANRFHVDEFYREEFRAELSRVFAHVVICEQTTNEGMLIRREDSDPQHPPTPDWLTPGNVPTSRAEPVNRLASGDVPPSRAEPVGRPASGDGPSSRPEPVDRPAPGEGLPSRPEPDFFIALCSLQPTADIAPAGDLFLLTPTEELRRLRAAVRSAQQDLDDKRGWAISLKEEVEELRSRLSRVLETVDRDDGDDRDLSRVLEQEARIAKLTRRMTEAEKLVALADAAGDEKEAKIGDLRRELKWRGRRVRDQEKEIGRLREDVATLRADARAQATTPQPPRFLRAASFPRFLIAATAPVEELEVAADVVGGKLAPGEEPVYLVGKDQHLLAEQLRSRGRETVALPRFPWQSVRLLPLLRWSRGSAPPLIVVPVTGNRGHRKIKLSGLLLGGMNAVILNENLDFVRARPLPLWRHLRWRWREFSGRRFHLARSAWGLVRQKGFSALSRRIADRRRAGRGPALPRALRWRAAMRQEALRIPEHRRPEVSIVIPVHNGWNYTYLCLKSIIDNTAEIAYEVILVDDASSDRTVTEAAKVSGLRLHRMDENVGFVGACLEGARHAKGQYLLFLNNDIVTTPGWLDALREVFRHTPDCAAVGAKLLYPDGSLQEAGGLVFQDGRAWNYGRGEDPAKPEYNYRREVDYCSGAALMVRREQYLEVGGLRADFAPGYWEDVDLCFNLRKAGGAVYYQPACELFHFEGRSAGTDLSAGMKKHQVVNGERFRKLWATELLDQPAFERTELCQARDRNRGPKVLVIDHYVPLFDRDTGSLFMHKFLMSLIDQGYRVVLWPDNQFRTPGYTGRLQAHGIEVRYGPETLRQFVLGEGESFSHAIVYRSSMAEKHLPLMRTLPAALGYIVVDLEHVRESRRRDVETDEEIRVEELRAREAHIVHAVDCVGVHSEIERDLIEEEFGHSEVVHLPLPLSEIHESAPGADARSDLIFVGSSHPPNVDAVHRAVEHVLPAIRARIPEVRLLVVGDVCESVRQLAGAPGLELLGYVQDLSAQLDKARVFIVPLRFGAGIKGKILEAMNHGVPVATTAIGAEGIGLTHGETAMIADDEDALVEATLQLYTDVELWQRVQAKSRAFIHETLSDDVFSTAVSTYMKRMAAHVPEQVGDDGVREKRA